MPKDTVSAIEKKGSVTTGKAQGVSVNQLAVDIGVSVDRLLMQFKDAQIKVTGVSDIVSEGEKQKLLKYLQQHHGANKNAAPERIVLRRTKTEIKVGGAQGAKKTIVQVRKKTYFHQTSSRRASKINGSRCCGRTTY